MTLSLMSGQTWWDQAVWAITPLIEVDDLFNHQIDLAMTQSCIPIGSNFVYLRKILIVKEFAKVEHIFCWFHWSSGKGIDNLQVYQQATPPPLTFLVYM